MKVVVNDIYISLKDTLVSKDGWISNKSSTSQDECPVCLDDMKNKNTLITRCKHEYCICCILDIVFLPEMHKRLCPMCRAQLV